jgi:high affinity Mn2+ porin
MADDGCYVRSGDRNVRLLIKMLSTWRAPVAALVLLVGAAGTAGAQAGSDSSAVGSAAAWKPYLLGTQINVMGQNLRPFRSPYEGANSLQSRGDSKISHAYGVYGGIDAGHGLQAYLDVEMVRGEGISRVVGLAGPTNGDVLRQGTADLGSGPYVARAFVRYVVSISSRERDTLPRAADQIPNIVSARRVELVAGKLAVSDLFDVNRYANSTRQQFMNWSLFQNTAWDFAADTRGYSNGVAIALILPVWAIRAGTFQMPRAANGNVFDSDLRQARGDQIEITVNLPRTHTTARILGYLNHARMGSYAEALAIGRQQGRPPDIAADDRPGRTKYGFGLNLEQPLSDDGETGLFARFGWSDGRNESFAFTEVDRHLSFGAQVAGGHWGRAKDRIGLGAVREGIVALHRDYLSAGGLGFLLGDGRLSYGPEEIVEGYYRFQLGPYLELSADMQHVRNPGYNRDRGPAPVLSLRINFRY